jgi:hypothetical protein
MHQKYSIEDAAQFNLASMMRGGGRGGGQQSASTLEFCTPTFWRFHLATNKCRFTGIPSKIGNLSISFLLQQSQSIPRLCNFFLDKLGEMETFFKSYGTQTLEDLRV